MMASWDYDIFSFSVESKNEIYSILKELGYAGKHPDRRFQNEDLSFRKDKGNRVFHLIISPKKSRLHFQLHIDLKKNGYHKGINGGNDVYNEKRRIAEKLGELSKCAR